VVLPSSWVVNLPPPSTNHLEDYYFLLTFPSYFPTFPFGTATALKVKRTYQTLTRFGNLKNLTKTFPSSVTRNRFSPLPKLPTLNRLQILYLTT